ncbi:MAG: hypothetical protein ACFCUU_10895 [Cyclobacteriaceae bacterium]
MEYLQFFTLLLLSSLIFLMLIIPLAALFFPVEKETANDFQTFESLNEKMPEKYYER